MQTRERARYAHSVPIQKKKKNKKSISVVCELLDCLEKDYPAEEDICNEQVDFSFTQPINIIRPYIFQ